MIYKIATSNSESGFQLSGKEELILFNKWKFWRNGISPTEFNKISTRDLIDIVEIDNAINEKAMREKEVNKLLRNIRTKW